MNPPLGDRLMSDLDLRSQTSGGEETGFRLGLEWKEKEAEDLLQARES